MSADAMYDACVIGGGPAGAAVAGRLQMLGRSVVVVDDGTGVATRLVASLPGAIWPFLEGLGAAQAVADASFPKLVDSVVAWGDPKPRIEPLSAGTFVVEQARFRELLLQNTESMGTRVLRTAHAGTPSLDARDDTWLTVVTTSEATHAIRSRLVLDASGGRAITGGPRQRGSVPTLALHGLWTGRWRPPYRSVVEALPEAWIWFAPFAPDRAAAAVFIDPKVSDRTAPSRRPKDLYASVLAQSELVRAALAGASLRGVIPCDATSRSSCVVDGDAPLKVGDANVMLDPLSSQGILTALADAFQTAIVANTLLMKRENRTMALTFYNDRRVEKIRRHKRKGAEIYGHASAVFKTPFWTRRRAAGEFAIAPPSQSRASLLAAQPIALSSSARLCDVPAIAGEVVSLARALVHRKLERPVAFLGSTPVTHFLAHIRTGVTAGELVAAWAHLADEHVAWQIANWMWQHGILTVASSSGRGNAEDHSERIH